MDHLWSMWTICSHLCVQWKIQTVIEHNFSYSLFYFYFPPLYRLFTVICDHHRHTAGFFMTSIDWVHIFNANQHVDLLNHSRLKWLWVDRRKSRLKNEVVPVDTASESSYRICLSCRAATARWRGAELSTVEGVAWSSPVSVQEMQRQRCGLPLPLAPSPSFSALYIYIYIY